MSAEKLIPDLKTASDKVPVRVPVEGAVPGVMHCLVSGAVPSFVSSAGKSGYLYTAVRRGSFDVENIPKSLEYLKGIADKTDSYIICLNSENICGISHIESAVFHAARSWFTEKAISKSFEMEVLLYAAGIRQCSGVRDFGLKKGRNEIYLCLCKTIGDQEICSSSDKDEISADVFSAVLSAGDKFAETVLGETASGETVPEGLNQISDSETAGFAVVEKFDNLLSEEENITDEKRAKLMKLFDISKDEADAAGNWRFCDLVIERTALLDIQK